MEDQWHEALGVYHDTIGEEIELLAALARVREQRALAVGALCEIARGLGEAAAQERVAATIERSRQYVGQQLAKAYAIQAQRRKSNAA